MKQKLVALRRITLLPTLSFVFAFFIGGIIIVVSDPLIMAQLNSPGKFLTAAASRIGNSYLAIFQGSIYDVNLARDSGVLRGFYPLSETVREKYGDHAAVLLGDALFAHALKLATEYETTAVCRIVAEATRQVCSGEIAQTFARGETNLGGGRRFDSFRELDIS